jgi:hypothetical protein
MLRPPKPRLRQVFEHTTSFKVTGPSGKQITIAKKGLSPSTVGRLRRFAQGGEVRGYDDGGEVTEPVADPILSAEEQRLSDAAQALAQSQPVEQPVLAQPEAVEEIAPPAPTVRHRPVTVAENAAAQVAPAAPVVVNVTTAPQPVAPQPAPQKMEAAPVVEEKAEEPEAPTAPTAPRKPVQIKEVPVQPPVRVTPPASAQVAPIQAAQIAPVAKIAPPDAGVVQPLAEMPELQPMLGSRQLVPTAPLAPSYPQLAPATLAAMAAPAAAPVAAAPVAPVAPAPAMAPVAPAVIPVLTAAKVVDAAKAMPNAQLKDVVASILGTTPEVAAAAMPDVAGIPAFALLRSENPKLVEALVESAVSGANAIKATGDALVAEQRAEIEALKAQELALAEQAKRDEEKRRDIDSHIAKFKKDAEEADDLKSFLGGEGSSQGLGRSILSIVSLAIGGFLSGYTNTPNYVLKAFNDAVERDLEEQKRKRDSRWARYKDALKSSEAADQLVRTDNKALFEVALKKASATQDLGKIAPKIAELQAQLQRQTVIDVSKLVGLLSLEELREAEAVRARRPPAVRPAAGPKGPREATPAELLRRQKYEEGRTVSVEGVPVQRNTDAGAANVTNELNGRNTAAESLVQLVDLFDKSTPEEAINLLGDKRAKLLAGVNYAVENFPMAFGYKRAVSVNAANVLKAGIDNPTGLKAYLLALAGGRNIATGLRELKDEVLRARDTYVRSLASTDKRDREAAELGLWRLASKEAALVKTKAPPKPKLDVAEDELLQTPYQRGLVMPATVGVSPVVPLAAPGAPDPATVAPTEAPAPAAPGKFKFLRPLP